MIACSASALAEGPPASVPAPIPPAAGVASWALPRRGKSRRQAEGAGAQQEVTPIDGGALQFVQQPRKIPLAFSFGLRSSSKHSFSHQHGQGRYRRHLGGGKWLRPSNHAEEYHQPGAEAFNEPALHCQTRLSPPRPSCPAPRPTSRLAASDRNSLGDSHVGQVEVVLPSRPRRGRSPSADDRRRRRR